MNIENLIQEDLKDRKNQSLREKVLREYYSNPNYCKCCNALIVVKKNESIADVKHRKFCNIECSNKYKRQHPEINIKYACLDNKNKSNCLNCGKEISRKNKYCSNKCQIEYQQKQWEEKWLNGKVSGNCNGAWQNIKDRVRSYLFKKYDNKCARCGWSEINPYTGSIPLEVEHIDGNAKNTTPENVTLLCPNCHSLTATYRGANRGNGRPKTWIPKTELDI